MKKDSEIAVKLKNPERHIFIQSFHEGTFENPHVKKLRTQKLFQLEKPFLAVDLGLTSNFRESSGKKSIKKGVKR